MHVPFSASDFINRAETVYADRVGIVDEPDQPAPRWVALTYAQVADLARRQAAKLDELGIGVGDRVAVISHNSARLFTSFFGVAGSGRVLVPVNFRLRPDEVQYIVEHSGARVLLVDPEIDEALKDVTAEHRFVLGQDEHLYARRDREARSRRPGSPTRTPPPASTTPPGRPRDPRACRSRTATSGPTRSRSRCTPGVTDRDVYLHTLPMFHANGWGMPFAMTGVGVKQVVIRKIDGAEILRRVEEHGVTVMCAAPAVAAAVLEAAQTWEGEIPGRDKVRIIMAGAPPPTKTVVRVEEELGWEFIQIYGLTETSPLLTVNRTPRRVGRPRPPRSAPRSWSAPARRRSA